MNRIEQPTQPRSCSGSSFEKPTFELESGLFHVSDGDPSYSFFAPQHYERKYAYPLIVWLHGPGGDERQLVRMMPLVSLRNYVAVAPRGFPLQGGTLPEGANEIHEGYGWPQSPDQIVGAAHRVSAAIRAAQEKFHIASHRVFLAGFDAGGTMAFRVAMQQPSQFAGVLSLCGAFPTGFMPFGRLLQARRLPVFLALGRDSLRYPPERACEDLRLFHTAGLSVTLKQYPCGQELCESMLRDIDRWMMDEISEGSRGGSEPDPRGSYLSD